jgi:filamentous hemagglutinin
VAQFGKYWQRVSLDRAIGRHAGPNATSWRTATGKTIYENPQTGRQVVVDDAGYFRIFQPRSIGDVKGRYLDMLGKVPSPATRVKGGAIKNMPLQGGDLNAACTF